MPVLALPHIISMLRKRLPSVPVHRAVFASGSTSDSTGNGLPALGYSIRAVKAFGLTRGTFGQISVAFDLLQTAWLASLRYPFARTRI